MTAIALVCLLAVILSPLALGVVEGLTRSSWTRLSEIGQTYGGAAAILTAVAFGGVIASLILQVRESKVSREQAVRSMHSDLVRMTMDEPELLRAIGVLNPQASKDELTKLRERQLVNLWLTYWHTLYDLDHLPAAGLRLYLREFFQGDAARSFWTDAGSGWPLHWHGRRHRQFCQIVDEEHLAALEGYQAQEPKPVAIRDKSRDVGAPEKMLAFAVGMAVGTGLAVLSARIRNRRL
ncbi:DUF6082 family protein [Streptosporangium soli]|nr:DUF6082 family protein [Streptosporangium sp. KLBMP 9127]